MNPSANTTVLLWEPDDFRFEAVAEVVRICGSMPTKILGISRLDAVLRLDQGKVAVVALGEFHLGVSESLDLIRTLKFNGFNVIAYGAGVLEWPIGVRCRALLSGASLLLDSSLCSFTADLGKALSNALKAQFK